MSDTVDTGKPARRRPVVESEQWVAHSRLFHVQEQVLRFGNGARRLYERLNPWHYRAVMVIPLLDPHTLLLVREYGAGLGDYYLSFPKGALNDEESVLDAANRELMEEAGYGARQLTVLRELALSPSYMGNRMTLVLAETLFAKRLPGDEPEPLDVVPWPVARLSELVQREDFCEAYAHAALNMIRERLLSVEDTPLG